MRALATQSPRLKFGGPEGIRTHDPLNAIQVLYQLSYRPDFYVNKAQNRTTFS